MKVRLEKSFEFREPTAAELARDLELARRDDDPELSAFYAKLPRYIDESDIRHLHWCNSGLIPVLRQLFTLLPDNRSLRGDRLPHLATHNEFKIADAIP